MKRVIISGSAKLQDNINQWVKYFENKNYEVLDYPKLVKQENYINELEDVYKNFYRSIENTDVFFLANEEKNGIKGYIGAGMFAELTYAVILNLVHNKNIEIYILNIPSSELPQYDEVKFFIDMGYIKLYEEKFIC